MAVLGVHKAKQPKGMAQCSTYLQGAIAFLKGINSLFHKRIYLNVAPTHSFSCDSCSRGHSGTHDFGSLSGQRCSHLPKSFPEIPKGNVLVVFREGEGNPAQLGGGISRCAEWPPLPHCPFQTKPCLAMTGLLPGESRGAAAQGKSSLRAGVSTWAPTT